MSASRNRLEGRASLGMLSELVVACALTARGRSIEARRVRVAGVELDLVTREGPVLAVVEVKARGRGAPEIPAWMLVSSRQRARLLRAAEALASRHDAIVHVDLAEVRWRPWPDVRIHVNALVESR